MKLAMRSTTSSAGFERQAEPSWRPPQSVRTSPRRGRGVHQGRNSRSGPNRRALSCVNSCIEHTRAITEPFESFYQCERGRAVTLAYALTGSREGAEDLVQDAFEALHRKWADIVDPAAYLRRTLTNLSTSRFRKLGSETRAIDRLRRRRNEFADLEPADAELWAAVTSLPHGQRAVVALYYLEDRSIDDVARILEIAPGTAKSALHDARSALARKLGTSDTEELSL